MVLISQQLAGNQTKDRLDYTLRQQNGVYTDRVYTADAADAITIVTAMQIFDNIEGATLRVKAIADNTGAMSIKVDNNAFAPIKSETGAALTAGQVKEDDIIFLVFDAANVWFTFRTEATDVVALDARVTQNEADIITNAADIASNVSAIALKANDNAVVKLTGAQSVAGVKTFSESPVVPAPTTDLQASTKKYVDDTAAGFVDVTTVQSIAGVKTFTDIPKVPLTAPTVDEEVAGKKYVDDVLAGAVLGAVPDNSIANIKLVSDIKVGSLAALTTTEKASVAGAINEVDADVGDLTTLTTTVKTSAVAAINEVDGIAGGNVTAIGDLQDYSLVVDIASTSNILAAYAERTLRCTNAGAINLNVQPNGTIAIPVNTEIAILQYGAGTVTFVEGAGVTINSVGGALGMDAQYSAATLKKLGTDEWILVGALV